MLGLGRRTLGGRSALSPVVYHCELIGRSHEYKASHYYMYFGRHGDACRGKSSTRRSTTLSLPGGLRRRRPSAVIGLQRRPWRHANPARVFSAGGRGNDDKDEEKSPPSFWDKARGKPGASSPPRVSARAIAVSGITSFCGIGALSAIHWGLCDASDMTLILGSFGATAVLVYGAPQVPFSQPRNVVGGHVLSAAVGVACHEWLSVPMGSPWLAAPVAVSASIMLMHATRTLHPPAGGTTLIAVLGSDRLHDLGFTLLFPTATGAFVLVGVALLNNLDKDRSYPTHWW